MEVVNRDSTAIANPDGGPPPDEHIRIAPADDHVVVRSGLRMLLDSDHHAGAWPQPPTLWYVRRMTRPELGRRLPSATYGGRELSQWR